MAEVLRSDLCAALESDSGLTSDVAQFDALAFLQLFTLEDALDVRVGETGRGRNCARCQFKLLWRTEIRIVMKRSYVIFPLYLVA